MRRSSRNSGSGRLPRPPAPVNRNLTPLGPINPPTPLEAQISELQQELEAEREGREHDKFYSAMAIGALVVIIVFMSGNAAAGSFAALIYVAALILLGKRYGVEGVIEALETAKRFASGPKDEKD